jgi:hypothetical protein
MRFRSGCGAGGSASCASKRLRRRSCRRRESSAAEPLMQTYPVERAQDISDALWSTSPLWARYGISKHADGFPVFRNHFQDQLIL